jgi:F0F1-type ATP synthase, subunit b
MDNMINLDHTIFIQLVNFLITLVVLNFLLIRPVRNQIAERNTLVQTQSDHIADFTSQASEKLASYEKSLSEARSQASLARDALKAEGNVREHELLQAAQNEAQAYLQSSREEVAKDVKTAMNALQSQVNDFADKAIAKILG